MLQVYWETAYGRNTQRMSCSKQQRGKLRATLLLRRHAERLIISTTLQRWADMCKLQQDIHRRGNRHVDQGTVPKSSLDCFAVEPLLGVQQCLTRASASTKFTCNAQT